MKIEQIAFTTATPSVDRDLWRYMLREDQQETTSWIVDNVVGDARVLLPNGSWWEGESRAELSFNYDIIPGKEFELLNYTQGENFLHGKCEGISHLGTHVEDIDQATTLLVMQGLHLVQEMWTKSHSNKAIAGKRRYHYRIFGPAHAFGAYIKLIKRIDL